MCFQSQVVSDLGTGQVWWLKLSRVSAGRDTHRKCQACSITFLGPLKIFLNPLPTSFDLSLGFPERPFCPSVPQGLESSAKSKASVAETRAHASICEWIGPLWFRWLCRSKLKISSPVLLLAWLSWESLVCGLSTLELRAAKAAAAFFAFFSLALGLSSSLSLSLRSSKPKYLIL